MKQIDRGTLNLDSMKNIENFVQVFMKIRDEKKIAYFLGEFYINFNIYIYTSFIEFL